MIESNNFYDNFPVLRGTMMSGKKNQQSSLMNDSSVKEGNEKNRETGIGIIGSIPWGTHLCQFYQTKEDLIDILVPYFKRGLEHNEFCMWITSEPLYVIEAKKALQIAVKNLDKYIKKGQIEILDSTEWYTKSGTFNAEEVLSGWVNKEAKAREEGYDGLRLSGNTFWLEKKDWEDFTKYEEVINHVISNYKMIAICSYSLNKCNASEIIDVVSNHQFALIKREGQWHRIESPEMKKAEVAINESRSLLETVFSSMNEAVVALNKAGNIINFNEAFAHFCKFKNKDECLRSVNDFTKIIKTYTLDGRLLPVEEWPAIRGLEGETGFNNEFLIERTDLGKTWISSTSFAPLRNKNGDIIGVVQTMHDITERKKSEQERDRQTQLLNQVQDAIIGCDPNFRITYWNKGAERMYGYSEAEALGKTTIGLLQPIYAPNERKKIIDELNRYGTAKVKIRTKHRNGTEIDVEVNSTRITDEIGNITGYVVSYRDVTDRERALANLREAELKYRTVADNTYDFEFWLNPEGHYLYASPSCKRITGYDAKEFLLDPSLRDKIIYGDDKQLFVDHVKNETSKKKPGEIEFRIVCKDGSIKWIHHVCQPIQDEKGKFIGIRGSNRDITERKQAEEAFKRSELNYRRLFESAKDGIFLIDFNTGMIVDVNPFLINLLGYSKNELLKKHLWEIGALKDIVSSRNNFLELQKKDYIRYEDRPLQTKEGKKIDVEFVSNVYHVDGKKTIQCNVRNITERKKAEEQLRETRDYLENLLNYANAPIIVWDKDFKIIKFNRAFEHLTGYSSKMMIGKKLDILFPKLSKNESLQKINRTLGGEYWKSVEIPILRKNGDIRVALWNSANIYDNSGKNLLATIAQGQDITERKQIEKTLKESEEKFRRIVENTTNVIMVTQPNGIISYLSPSCEEVLGHQPEELIGTNPVIFHPDDIQKVQHLLAKALNGEKGSNLEYRILTKQGKIKWITHSWSPLFVDNNLHSIISVITDVTERKITEENIKKLNENLLHRTIELAAANKELEAFSYSVSHDLRAPLRSIDGFSQALIEDYTDTLDEQAKEYLQRVRKASQRMGQLIDDLLKLSRLTRVEMTINKVDLSETATTIIEEFKKEEPTRKIDFILHDKLIADGDANLLRILLENILGNAWKFTKKCKRAKIEFGKTQQGKETVFFVRDNGAGFDMKYANKLFIPFQRLHDDIDYPGTGIGLGIVSRIIHRHRGRIWAEAEENKGATFYFTIGGKNNE